MVLRAGGAGAYGSLACPFIPAVKAALEAASGVYVPSSCPLPAADIVQQITTGTTNVYAAVVWAPPQVVNDGFLMSGKGNPRVTR